MIERKNDCVLLGALLATSALGSPALAQTAPVPPLHLATDANGVDLVSGKFTFAMTEASIGPAADPLTLERYYGEAGYTDNWSGTLARKTEGGQTVFYITQGPIADKFVGGTSVKGDGSTLTVNAQGDTYTYTAADGTVITYSIMYDNLTILT